MTNTCSSMNTTGTMLKQYAQIIVGLMMLFTLASCYSPRYVYSPAAVNVPVFTKKGDSKIAAWYSNSTFGGNDVKQLYNYGFDVQAAYAISSHWLLMVNQTNRYEKTASNFTSFNLDSSTIRYKRYLTEIGGGYFSPVKKSSKVFVQLTGGMGFGKFSFDDNGRYANSGFYSRYHQTRVLKFFLQPTMQVRYNKHFNHAFVSRVSFINYHGVKTNYTNAEQQQYLLQDLTTTTRVFWEPAIINNFSFAKLPAIQFGLQFGIAALISKQFVDYRSLNIAAGVVLDLSKMGKGDKKEE